MGRRSRLTYALSTLAMGATLVLITSVGTQATDAIDDPVRQPHLKSWSNIIPNANRRFVVLADFNNEAVLDRETGLVWEQNPAATPLSWAEAGHECLRRIVGGRRGFRLPSVVELSSLLDLTVSPIPGPVFPLGHPFANVQREQYWTATTLADSPTRAWVVFFAIGDVVAPNKPQSLFVWCVRGPMQESVY